uniref:Kinesin motor domain-containing protein n=1 Tax=Musa acuminata subsp. malaccensis TaxID=214687 RepID=A0A804KGU7_MUSAM|nr:PREDICTED: kinesin-like protein KIN-12B [Musa acuminata subsp. malaccensis]
MKAFTSPRSTRVPPSETLAPSSHKQRPPRIPKENVDPCPAPPDRSPFHSHAPGGKPLSAKNRSPLPPRPPLASKHSANPLKRKLILETIAENGVPPSSVPDSGVQVIVRMRPPGKQEEEADLIVEKASVNSLSILDHTFTFDSVADIRSTQEDIFRLVGLPLVENCLAGFNSSIFAYGQTGSGKTYTMWGPPSVMSEGASSTDRGLTPRVFERLFCRIDEEQSKHSDKQLNYQCRCSFLEIYNEQITDLLEPTQRNLQIREDVRTGVYVDYLTEEYVSTVKDVNNLLMKGLANRRTGATSINVESSRSHCVFTCIIESRSKSVTDGLVSLKTSRINLVDLAGSERQKQTGAGGERLKEAGNINRSLSQLGNLINILAEVSHSGKQRHIPYRDSKLTFLLQESLGGNAKLAMICAISPSRSCKNETLSTLRFAQRAKAIRNKAVVNEIMQDDVNVLREQIRLLKDELLRMKSNGSSDNNGGYSTGWNARRSLHILKMSLTRPTPLPIVNDDSDEEMEIDENDVEMPCVHAASQVSPCVDRLSADLTVSKENDFELRETGSCQVPAKSDGKAIASIGDDLDSQLDANREVIMHDEMIHVLSDSELPTERKPSVENGQIMLADPSYNSDLSSNTILSPSNLSIEPCHTSPVLQSPTLNSSPIVDTSTSRKSLRTSLSMSASQKNILENVKSSSGAVNASTEALSLDASLSQIKRSSLKPTEHLTASLQHGRQVIDNWQQNSVLRRSSFRFSVRPTEGKPLIPVNKVDVGIQALEELEDLPNICSYCKNAISEDENKDGNKSKDLQLVPVDGLIPTEKPKMHVPKAVEQVLAGSIRREMALEDHSAKQAAEIMQLERLVQQYKYERECNAMIAQTREDKISRLERLMDGILPTEEFMEEEFIALVNEHKLLKEKYENDPEVSRVNIELKRVQDELDGYRNFFVMGERDVLMEEIQDLRSQLKYYMESSSAESTKKPCSLIQLTHQGRLSTTTDLDEISAGNKVEVEKGSWTERESNSSLVEELKLALEASRSVAEKLKLELESEKKCAEELKEALQTAMQGHTRILEQYAELQEKHTALLLRNRKISDDIDNVMEAAAEVGVKDAESKFVKSLAAEISVLKSERGRERQQWRDENKALQTQLRDTAEALQAAGELLVRLKEAEETAAIAEKRALLAEKETEKANEEIDSLKKNHDREIISLKQILAESRSSKEALEHTEFDDSEVPKSEEGKSEQRWTEDFEPFCKRGDTELSMDTDPNSWFAGYDRCNI